jgi:type II secretory pathway pseudopilin PulG
VESGRAEAPAKASQGWSARGLTVAGLVLVVAAAAWFLTRPARQRAKARHDVEVLALALDGFAREQRECPRSDFAQICRLLLGETVDGQNPRKLDYVEAQQYEISTRGEFVDTWGTPYRVLLSPAMRV